MVYDHDREILAADTALPPYKRAAIFEMLAGYDMLGFDAFTVAFLLT